MPLRPENLELLVARAQRELIEAAKAERLTNYGDLITSLGTSRRWIGEVLLEVAQREHRDGRPPLTALVVGKQTREPGKCFWALPMMTRSQSAADEHRLWLNEVNQVWGYWR